MAGHSKWANIKHRKGRADAKRGKLFTKIIRELTVAAKEGGGDLNDNPALRLAVDKAKSMNMPKETMERAIKRGAGNLEEQPLERVFYEGYGPYGVAVMVETLTDNRNRTVAEVRHAFTKVGGSLGVSGSVAYLFEKRGEIIFGSVDEETLLEQALELGADDVVSDPESGLKTVYTQPSHYLAIKKGLITAGLEPVYAACTLFATTQAALTEEQQETIIKLIDRLEELDDVQEVYTTL